MMRWGAVALCVVLAGCSTITRGTSQAVSITTPGAEGARCELFSPALGSQTVVTPATVTLEKSQHNVQVTCKKPCFHDGTGVITSSVEEMTAGNVIFGGVVGLGVDAASGAMNKYAPNVQVAMAPMPGCRR
jgi:hypothetical protein